MTQKPGELMSFATYVAGMILRREGIKDASRIEVEITAEEMITQWQETGQCDSRQYNN